MAKRDRLGGMLLVAGLTLGVLGQFYFSYRRQYVWDGALFWGVGILCLSILLRRAIVRERGRGGGRPRARAWLSSIVAHPLRAVLAGGGLWLSFAAGWLARGRPADADFSGLLFLWLTGIAAFVLAFLPPLGTPATWLRRLARLWHRARSGQIEYGPWLAGGALVLLALVVRAYDLEHIPANLGGDEGTWAMEGLAMLEGPLDNPFATRWFAFPSMSFLVWGLSMRVFGDTVAGVRAVSALIGTASVVTTFLLVKELWGQRVAWLAGVALAVGHYHLHYSRLAVNNIADSLVVTVAFYLLVRGFRSGRAAHFCLAGVVIGAGWYGYIGARLVGILAALYVVVQMAVEHRLLARHGRHLLVLLVAALVVAAPLLLFYAAHPGVLTEGLNRVSVFSSGWLEREVEITGRSKLDLMLQQLWRSVSAFNYTLDPTFWYRPGIPLLDALSGVLFVFGLIWCTAHWRRPSSALILIWFWTALVSGWVTTENPPSSQRLVIVTPALAALVAVGLDRLVGLLRRLVPAPRRVTRGLVALIVVAVVALNLRHYFLVYTPSRVYGNPAAELATHLARRLQRQDDGKVVYFHGPPFIYWEFGTLRFMARGVSGMDVPFPGEGEPPTPDLSRGARFVFHPARLDELDSVEAQYPGGTETFVRSRVDDQLLYATYEVSR